MARHIEPTAQEKVIKQARALLALRDENGWLKMNSETISAMQYLSVLIQHMDADEAGRWNVGAKP